MNQSVAILGVGMHPWGKWGKPFTEYGIVAAEEALEHAKLNWSDVELVSGANTMRCGYPGYISGATFADALGSRGTRIASSYAACASGAMALQQARAHILAGFCEVALVVGADTAPKGFFAPTSGDRPSDPDWLRFRLLGATNPVYFGLYARRRMDVYGASLDDFSRVKIKNSRHGLHNKNARYHREYTEADMAKSPVVSDPLRLLDICATSDGAACVILSSIQYAKKTRQKFVELSAISTMTPTFPNPLLDLPNFSNDSWAAFDTPKTSFRKQIATLAYEEAGIGPRHLDLAEVYDLSTALELDWYEELELCPEGEAEVFLRSGATEIGGKIPVNPSGGLSSFGEAVPAQALAQLCELTWQLRGEAGQRQVTSARVGLAINQGLFGHGSAMIAKV